MSFSLLHKYFQLLTIQEVYQLEDKIYFALFWHTDMGQLQENSSTQSMKIILIFISLLATESNSIPVPAYPIIAAGTSIISLVQDLVAKQTAPALAAPSVGLTNKFSEWKPKLVAGQEVYSNKATEVLRDIYENIERLTKQTNKIASEVNRTDDIGKNNFWMILSLVLYSRWTSLPDHHKSFQQPEWKIGGRPG